MQWLPRRRRNAWARTPLNDPLFLAIVPDEVLHEVITGGRPGTPMPAFSRRLEVVLTDAQIAIIAAGLKRHWKVDSRPPAELPSYSIAKTDAPTGGAAVERGEQVFAAACATCHGENGAGTGEGESPGGINDPALLSLFSDQVLRRIIITGRADLGMPNFAGTDGRNSDFKPLSGEQIDDLVALLVHWRSSPAKIAAAASAGP